MAECRLGDGILVGDYISPYIIAEVNSSHGGSVDVAMKMVDAAVDAGCNCVKFQSWSTESLYSDSYYKQNPIAKRFVKKFSMGEEKLRKMAEYCREKGVGFSSTPYSEAEVDFLVEIGVPFIKIASMDLNNTDFLRYIAKKQLPLILSTGMGEMEEIEKAVQVIEEAGNQNLILLHCVSIYPAKEEIICLNNILGLRERFPQCPIGFSDHTLGDEVAIGAVAMGASVIEKHLTLDKSKIGMDNQMAMEAVELKEMVRKCRLVQKSLGSKKRILVYEEYEQRKNMRRSIVSAYPIPKGKVLDREDLTLKRPGTGFSPQEMEQIIGRRAAVDIGADLLIRDEYLE